MSWTEEDFSAFNRARGRTAFATAQHSLAKPTKKHKYRARPCIVTPDLTLFTKEDVFNSAAMQRPGILRDTTPLKELAQACGIVGDWFGSEKEAKRYIQLAQLEKTGAIRELRRQVPYALLVNGIKIAEWRADFVYEEFYESAWLTVREDSKGVRTPEYQLKKKIAEAHYGWSIRET